MCDYPPPPIFDIDDLMGVFFVDWDVSAPGLAFSSGPRLRLSQGPFPFKWGSADEGRKEVGITLLIVFGMITFYYILLLHMI